MESGKLDPAALALDNDEWLKAKYFPLSITVIVHLVDKVSKHSGASDTEQL